MAVGAHAANQNETSFPSSVCPVFLVVMRLKFCRLQMNEEAAFQQVTLA